MRHRRGEGDALFQKKSMGQVFLKTEWPVQRMVERLVELRVERVMEIGPGAGILTRGLLNGGIDVTAVEKDERFAERLTEYAKTVGALADAADDANASGPRAARLTVVAEDALAFDWEAWVAQSGKRAAIVGNIPYNISSPLLLRGVGVVDQLVALLFMTQLEFTARVIARPGTKDFGSLTVYVQLRAEPSMEFKVERACFQPVPKVDSAVLLVTPRRDRLDAEVLKRTEQVTRAAFTQRRKKLRNSVRPFLEGRDEAACPIDLERRADTLSPREFVTLTNYLFHKL